MKRLSLKQIFIEGIGDFYGADTFQGTGNYGVGNQRQLLAIDPAVKNIQDQEQEELNRNVDHLQARLRKWKKSFGGPIGPIEPTQVNINRGIGSNPIGGGSKLKLPLVQKLVDVYRDELEEQRIPGDWMYRDMRGNPENSLEAPRRHVPSDRAAEIAQEMEKSHEDYSEAVENHYEELQEAYPYTTIDKIGGDPKIGRVDPRSNLIYPRDFLSDIKPQDETNYGNMSTLVAPKKYVPDSFEGRQDYTDDWTDEHYRAGSEDELLNIEDEEDGRRF